MAKPQTITTPTGDELVVLPKAEYEDLLAAARDNLDDVADARAAAQVLARLESGEEDTFPHDVVKRLRKENPIKVLREHRRLTQRELAEAADINPLYLSQIETGRATGGLRTLTRLAQVLRVSLDLIAPPAVRSERD